jgi:hypothetical protein
VLRANDVGGWTQPAPRLYPHQWSWDSAFIAIGLAHVDPDRALRELESLFAAQWADGRVPQIVYAPTAPPDAYFPDADRWACSVLSPAAPQDVATSGLVQPPVHAIAVWRICESISKDGQLRQRHLLRRLDALYPKLLAWHRYLATARDPEGSGLITIYHPWESGTDNSPRWDAVLAKIIVGEVPPYSRRDLQHVADPSQRPVDAEYRRYLWLVESLKRACYDEAEIHRTHPFLAKDVLFSAIFVAAERDLARLGERLGQDVASEAGTFGNLNSWRAVLQCWDDREQLAFDLDLRAGEPIPARTVAGLAPLLIPKLGGRIADALVRRLSGSDFAGAPGLAFPVVPSTAPGAQGFNSRSYWRGPVWPIANWLLWRGLRQQGYRARADALRRANLALLAQPTAHFAEYFDPFTGEPLGSINQSWTAAVALDWLATPDPPAE